MESSDDQLEGITTYINEFLPHLNTDIVNVGISDFFEKKLKKWGERKIPEKAHFLYVKSQPNEIFDYSLELRRAKATSEKILFRLQAIDALTETEAHVKAQNPDKLCDVIETLDHLKVMKVSRKEVQRLGNLHTFFCSYLQELMGIDSEHLSKSFKNQSTVVVIDKFKKYLQGENGRDIPHNIAKQPDFPKWKKGDEVRNALPWEHGDTMANLIEIFSPKSGIRRAIRSSLEDDSYFHNFSQLTRTPLVFNCSWGPFSPRIFIRQEGQEIKHANR